VNVWIVNAYGVLPGEAWRDHYSALLGGTLAEANHNVTWWTAAFSHHFKRHRARNWKTVPIKANFEAVLVPTPGYTKHISVRRLLFEIVFAIRFYRHADSLPRPDVIISLDSQQFSSYFATRLKRRYRSKLVLSVQDLWPELFVLACPRFFRPVLQGLLWPLFMLRKAIRGKADGIVSLAESYLVAALTDTKRGNAIPSCVIFNGVVMPPIQSNIEAHEGVIPADTGTGRPEAWPPGARDNGVSDFAFYAERKRRNHETWVVYSGTLGNNYDITTLVAAAALVKAARPLVRFIITGAGPLRDVVIRAAADERLGNVIYLGIVSNEVLQSVYRLCDIGVCAYGPSSNVAMPDKAYDYIAGGLPMVSSLKGELQRYVEELRLGLQYAAGDPESLRSAIIQLVDDPTLRATMAENARRASRTFDRGAQMPKIVTLVESLFPH
jgi:glycosyltransferase involved in cell wall biosynthesis